MLTRDEILAVYERGSEAVVGLVHALEERQEARIAQLEARIGQLEEILAKNSRNSGKPPSSDVGKPKPKSLRRPSGRKSGGQPGHRGETLTMVDEADCIVMHEVSECEGCGRHLGDVRESKVERRQVFDLPELVIKVTEHQAQHKRCPGCGHRARAEFPPEVGASVQYGARIKGLGVYLNEYQLLPLRRTAELLSGVFGASFGEGTLRESLRECHEGLAGIEGLIARGVQGSEVAHFDETGLRVGGKGQWLHSASTGTLTHYGVHPKRGSDATRQIGILPGFAGTAVHDSWNPYYAYACTHALCNAHHLRDLTFLHEQLAQEWAGGMKSLLVEMKASVGQALQAGLEGLEPEVLRGYEQRYQELVGEGMRANPPPDPGSRPPGKPGPLKRSTGRKLVDRLDTRRGEVLAFMYDFSVPFDNNQAERDIRMVKTQQKVSGCFRTTHGAAMFCRIRGYLSTARKQGHNTLDAIQRVFRGDPFIPTLYPE